MYYTLVYMVFVVDGRSLSLIVIMEISYVLHTCLHGICYRWSKSLDFRKVNNESRCSVISCCLLAGQCPTFMAFFFIFCPCGALVEKVFDRLVSLFAGACCVFQNFESVEV